MTIAEKQAAFFTVAAQVRAIQARIESERLQRIAQAQAATRYADLTAQRDAARKTRAFSILA